MKFKIILFIGILITITAFMNSPKETITVFETFSGLVTSLGKISFYELHAAELIRRHDIIVQTFLQEGCSCSSN